MTIGELDRAVPFGSLAAAWSRAARRALHVPAGVLAPSAVDDLESALTRRLADTAGRALLALYADGNRAEGAYARFVAHHQTTAGDDELDAAFPVLARLRSTIVRQWFESVQRLAADLATDAPLLTGALGDGDRWLPIVGVRTGLGDPHRDGRMVTKLVPDAGRSVAYKPRPFAVEAALYGLLERVAGSGDEKPLVWAADRGDHGWMAWVDAAPVSDPAVYWRNAGRATAVLHVGGAVDLHHGNVLVAGDTLVPVDLECSNTPILEDRPPHEQSDLDSVLATGLFPGWFGTDGPVAREVCGLLGDSGTTDGSWYTRWTALGTDDIGFDRRIGFDAVSQNLPIDSAGRAVPLDIDALLDGLGSTLQMLAADPTLGDLGDPPSRLVLRGTGLYANLIHRLLDADNLADPARFDAVVADLPEIAEDDWRFVLMGRDGFARFRASETAALARLDIPLFRSHGRDIELDDGTVLSAVLPGTGEERRAARVARLTASGIRSEVAAAALAIEQHSGVVPASSGPGPAQGRRRRGGALEAAVLVGEQLLADAVMVGGRPTWPELAASPSRRGFRVRCGGTDLYGGTDGVACAFAALALLSGEERWATAARDALWVDAPDPAIAPGWPGGAAGHAYARHLVGRLLGEQSMVASAVASLARVLEVTAESDPMPKLDLVDGRTGLLAVASTFVARGGADVALLREHTRALLDDVVDATAAQWDDEVAGRRLRSIGVAHAGTGVAMVLHRGAVASDRPDAAVVADRILDHENAKVDRRGGVGAAIERHRGGRAPRPGWCWGGAGFLLARLDPALDGRTEAAHLRATVDAVVEPHECRSGLCCGRAGTLVAADEASRHGVPGAAELAASLRSQLIAEAEGAAPSCFVPPLSFAGSSLFMGRAGVAYALARVADPERIPNVLTIG